MSGMRMVKATLTSGPRRGLYARFEVFHAENPQVYTKLRELALQAAASGRKVGIAALFERLRWWSQVETTGEPYKLNNSYRAPYARLLMQEEPALRGFFTTRQDRTDPDYRGRIARVRPARRRAPVVPVQAAPRPGALLF